MHIKEFKLIFLITVEENLCSNIFSLSRFMWWLKLIEPQWMNRTAECQSFLMTGQVLHGSSSSQPLLLLSASPPPAGRLTDLHPKPCCLCLDKTLAVLSDPLMLARKPPPRNLDIQVGLFVGMRVCVFNCVCGNVDTSAVWHADALTPPTWNFNYQTVANQMTIIKMRYLGTRWFHTTPFKSYCLLPAASYWSHKSSIMSKDDQWGCVIRWRKTDTRPIIPFKS